LGDFDGDLDAVAFVKAVDEGTGKTTASKWLEVLGG